jgi:hypothetical protein
MIQVYKIRGSFLQKMFWFPTLRLEISRSEEGDVNRHSTGEEPVILVDTEREGNTYKK